jgi:predicted nucleic acid-binding protein
MIPRLALDTNAYRALDDGNVKLAKLVRTCPQIGLPVIVLGEIYFGIFLGKKQEQNITNLNRFVSSPRVETLMIDEATTKIFGEIATLLRKSGRPIQQDDMWIAALCKRHDFALATAGRDFEAVIGLEIVSF